MFIEAIVSFAAFWLLFSHLSPAMMRRLVGYKGITDLVLHGTIIFLFMGTMSGLLQAEAAAILFSVSLRLYRRLWGYERLERDGVKLRWMRYAGYFTGRKSKLADHSAV